MFGKANWDGQINVKASCLEIEISLHYFLNLKYVIASGAKIKVNAFKNILLNTEIRSNLPSGNIKNALCIIKFALRYLHIEEGSMFKNT